MVVIEFLNSFLQWAQGIVGAFGYFGIFIVSMIATSTVILPTYPLSIIIFFSGAILNPLLVGLIAGFGTSIGEMVGFVIGRGGEKILIKKYKKEIKQMEKLFQRFRGEIIIFLIAAIPIVPFDVVGLFCGIVGFDVKKFYISLLLGKMIRYTFIAFAGYFGVQWILGLITTST